MEVKLNLISSPSLIIMQWSRKFHECVFKKTVFSWLFCSSFTVFSYSSNATESLLSWDFAFPSHKHNSLPTLPQSFSNATFLARALLINIFKIKPFSSPNSCNPSPPFLIHISPVLITIQHHVP